MNMDQKNILTYCVYCDVGKDNHAVDYLNKLGYSGLSFQQVKRFYHERRVEERRVPLLPRYVFFDAPLDEVPDLYRIRSSPSILKILQYGDGERAVRDEDLRFVQWMKRIHGILEMSQVMQVGTRIKVVGGPLKEYEGKIIEVKKQRKMVAIELSGQGHFGKIWCPIEYIESL